MATACILAELGADETSVAAALLKDVLLKSMMTEVQLRNVVNESVADLVIKVGRLDDLCQVRLCDLYANTYQSLHSGDTAPFGVNLC